MNIGALQKSMQKKKKKKTDLFMWRKIIVVYVPKQKSLSNKSKIPFLLSILIPYVNVGVLSPLQIHCFRKLFIWYIKT